MDVAPGPNYYFDDVEIDVERGTLKRDGEDVFLRQKTFQVLTYLVRHRGTDLPKDQIIADVWQDTAVVDDVLVQSIKDIRRALDDDPHKPRFIRTLPKLGYRFIAPEIRSEKAGVPQSYAAEKQQSLIRSRLLLIVISACILASIVLGFAGKSLWNAEGGAAAVRLPQTPGKKNILVTFFENQSDNKELDWLREGLTDMMITGFSRSSNLAVLSRGQLHVLLERRGIDPAAKFGLDAALLIAGSSGAEMVTTGSFGKLGDKVRIEVQLHDSRSGELLAAESLAVENPEMILTEIDLLSRKLVSRVNGTVDGTPAPAISDVMTDNLEAYRYYSIAVEKANAVQNADAIVLLEKATALDPQFAMAHARIGYAYAVTWDLPKKGKSHLEKAFQLSARLTEKDRLNIAAWYAIANLDYGAAIEQFREIIAKFPSDTEAYYRLSRLLRGEGQVEDSITVLKQGLTIDPDSKLLNNGVGGTLAILGRHDEAIAAHKRYLALAPNEPNAYDSLGTTYEAAGEYESAVVNFERALESNPNFDVAIIHLANTRYQTGRYREAIELFHRYIRIAPSDNERARGHGSLAWLYLSKADFGAAEKAAAESLRLGKDWTWMAAMVALERGDIKRGSRYADRSISNEPEISRGARMSRRPEYYRRGYYALKKGLNEEAIANFRLAVDQLRHTWDLDSFEDCLANAYLETGRFSEAIAEYQRVLSLNPNYPRAEYNLARAYEKIGDRENAVASYRRFLEIWKNADPELPAILSARESLDRLS